MYEHSLPVHFDFNENCEACQAEKLELLKTLKGESVMEGLLEQKEELDLARDYRSLNASQFFEKYLDDYFDDVDWPEVLKFLQKIDSGLETYDWL